MLAGLARPEIKFDCRTKPSSLSSSLGLFNENGRGKTTNSWQRNSKPKPPQGRMCWWTRWTTCRDDGITICLPHKFYITLLDNRQQVLSVWKFKFVIIFNFYTLQFNKLLSCVRSRVDAWSCGCLDVWSESFTRWFMSFERFDMVNLVIDETLCVGAEKKICKAKLNFIHEKLTLIFRWFGFVHTSSFDQVPMCRRIKSWNFQISRLNFTRHISSLLSLLCLSRHVVNVWACRFHFWCWRWTTSKLPPINYRTAAALYCSRARLDVVLCYFLFRLCVRVWSSQKRVDESEMGRTTRGERRKMGIFLTMMMMTATRAQRATNLSPPLQVSFLSMFFFFFRLFLFSWATMECLREML